MNKFFYQKLAINNIKKNIGTYFPYILTCVGTILMFYNLSSMAYSNETTNSNLVSLLSFGTVVVGFFSLIFLFYTNSFLIKRRKKEFGLFNVLGMEKTHISKIMFWENLFVGMLSIGIGLLLGIVFNKVLVLLLYKILKFDPQYDFYINTKSVIITLIFFIIIFILTLLNNIMHVRISNPIELLSSRSEGEREPKSKWLITAIGIISLAVGYYISFTSTASYDSVYKFFAADILVIIGTYCIFTSGTIIFLKMLKKNKKYYYKTKNFISVSSMIYRMKKNAVGLASICVLSTAVIVVISTTVSMFAGIDDEVSTRYPYDVSVENQYIDENEINKEDIENSIDQQVSESGLTYKDYTSFSYLDIATEKSSNEFSEVEYNALYSDEVSEVIVFTADEYYNFSGKQLDIPSGEVYVISDEDYDYENITILDTTYDVAGTNNSMGTNGDYFSTYLYDVYAVIVPDDETMNELYTNQLEVYGEYASSYEFVVNFDLNGSDADKKNFEENLSGVVQGDIDAKQLSYDDAYELYGGIFFLGIFLGILFLMITVLIIYYKQMVEGADDKERFLILKKVGISEQEIRTTIRSQVLTVFFIPIGMAIIHIIFAFPMLVSLLEILNLTNVELFAKCSIATIVVFFAIYIMVYSLTAKVYYKIVNVN